MTHFYKEVLKRKKKQIVFLLFWGGFCYQFSFLAEVLDSTLCNCVDLMNRSMHNFISRNASISHFTKEKDEKKT